MRIRMRTAARAGRPGGAALGRAGAWLVVVAVAASSSTAAEPPVAPLPDESVPPPGVLFEVVSVEEPLGETEEAEAVPTRITCFHRKVSFDEVLTHFRIGD